MAVDDSRDRLAGEGASAEQAASQVGAMVADRVRTALESAERAAAEVRRRALEQASADREAVHGAAALVTARIDLIEAEVGHLLQELREDVALVVAEADRAADAAVHDAEPEPEPVPEPVPPLANDEPSEPNAAGDSGEVRPEANNPAGADPADSSNGPPERRRSGLFRRRARGRACGVCGRAAPAGAAELERWQQASGTSLCPECQAAGWQLPQRGTVPYRSVQSAARS